jgi:calcineurin-like phosphoesterase family protein
MNSILISNWNNKVSPDDIVYHLGDFCFKGSNTSQEFEKRLNGTITHIQGNHDSNNGVKTLITKAVMEFGNKTILAQHHPPQILEEIPEWCDFVLCGHVHQHWKSQFLSSSPIPIINVGVDVWNFEPISIDTILKYYDKLKNKEKKNV